MKVLEQAEIASIETLLLKSQLRWAGHVSSMDDHHLPMIALYGELSTGHRDRGAPKKRYKHCLKKSLDSCHIDHYQWSTLAADREAWRSTVHKAVSSFEHTHRAILKEKRLRTKTRRAPATSSRATTNPSQASNCSRCDRTCLPRIGLNYKSPGSLQSTWYKCSFIDLRQTKLKPHSLTLASRGDRTSAPNDLKFQQVM